MNPQKIAQDYGISVDEVRSRWMQLRVSLWKSDFKRFCREVIKVRAKDGSLVPLVLNEAQSHLLAETEKMLKETGWVRIAFLKGRRQGASTFTAARGYWKSSLFGRQNIYILAHEMASSSALFDMVDLMQQEHPFAPRVDVSNAKQLRFEQLGSTYTVATAGQKGGGRGMAISFFHGSECAHWSNAIEHFASSVQAVDEVKGVWGVLWREPENPLPFEKGHGIIEGWVKSPSEVYLETTSAGPTGEFHKRYMDAMKGIGSYRAAFVPWTLQKEYTREGDFTASRESEDEGMLSEAEYQSMHGLTDGQMLWRREKIIELGSVGKFMQEYPVDVTEAFSAASTDGMLFAPANILKARKRRMPDPDAPLIMGVDPAGAGGDRFAVSARRGDKILWVKYRNKLEHDEAIAWLSALIDEHKPNRMFIDRGSMGGNILSSLRNIKPEYADIVRGTDFGGKSTAKMANPNKAGPWNKRAEIYGRFAEWLADGSIPDDDDLASDMAAIKLEYRANNDWLLRSKSKMKAEGIRSSDLSDSCALTFSQQEWFDSWSAPKKATGFTKGVDYSHQSRDMSNNTDPYSWMGSL